MKTSIHTAPITAFTAQGGREYQEDRFVCARLESFGAAETGGLLMAVLDGHGGAETAEVARQDLPGLFADALSSHPDSVERAFLQTVRSLDQLTKAHSSGSTLSAAFVPDGDALVFTATLGDSSVLVHDGNRLHVSADHNVRTNMTERRAALARGGLYDGGYLLDPETGLGLQMSRALGNARIRHLLDRRPHIARITLRQSSWILLGTDGLFDASHLEGDASRQRISQRVMEGADADTLVQEALALGGQDNTTAIIWRRSKA